MNIKRSANKEQFILTNAFRYFTCNSFINPDTEYDLVVQNNIVKSCSCPDQHRFCKHIFLLSKVQKDVSLTAKKTLQMRLLEEERSTATNSESNMLPVNDT